MKLLSIILGMFFCIQATAENTISVPQVIFSSEGRLLDATQNNKVLFHDNRLLIKNLVKMDQERFLAQDLWGGLHIFNRYFQHEKLNISTRCPVFMKQKEAFFYAQSSPKDDLMQIMELTLPQKQVRIIGEIPGRDHHLCPLPIGSKRILWISNKRDGTYSYTMMSDDLKFNEVDFGGFHPKLYIGNNIFLAWKNGYFLIDEHGTIVREIPWHPAFAKSKSGAFVVAGHSEFLKKIFFIENRFSIFQGEYGQIWAYDLDKNTFKKNNGNFSIEQNGILDLY